MDECQTFYLVGIFISLIFVLPPILTFLQQMLSNNQCRGNLNRALVRILEFRVLIFFGKVVKNSRFRLKRQFLDHCIIWSPTIHWSLNFDWIGGLGSKYNFYVKNHRN